MEWNLQSVLHCDGKRMPIELSLDMKPEPGDDFQFLTPVTVTGEFVNIGGSLELTAKGRVRLERVCDRCAESFEMDLDFPIFERLKKADFIDEENEDPDLILVEGNTIEADDIIYGALYMNVPSKSLCREDCKGLCPICGQNRNAGVCSCDDRPTDPRFDILDQLL